MRRQSRVAAFAVAAALSFSMAVPAFAATATVPSVSKTLQVNNGSSVTAQFQYTATPIELTVGSTAEKTYTDGPNVAIANVDLTATNAAATGTGAITFGGKTDASAFKHAGTYAWKIQEATGTYTGIGEMQYDSQVYTLIATVENGENGLQFGSFTIVKGEATSTANENKADSLAFTNEYTETTSNQDTATDLTITKKVSGTQADKTKAFEFTVTFDASSLTVLPKGKTAAQVLDDITATANGATDLTPAAASGKTRTFTFKAADAKAVTFSNVLAGVTYTVKEADAAGYSQSYAAVSNGDNVTATSGVLVGENTNTGTMTNTYTTVTPTGLIVNNAPFIMLGGVAVAGVVAYGAAKRKLEN